MSGVQRWAAQPDTTQGFQADECPTGANTSFSALSLCERCFSSLQPFPFAKQTSQSPPGTPEIPSLLLPSPSPAPPPLGESADSRAGRPQPVLPRSLALLGTRDGGRVGGGVCVCKAHVCEKALPPLRAAAVACGDSPAPTLCARNSASGGQGPGCTWGCWQRRSWWGQNGGQTDGKGQETRGMGERQRGGGKKEREREAEDAEGGEVTEEAARRADGRRRRRRRGVRGGSAAYMRCVLSESSPVDTWPPAQGPCPELRRRGSGSHQHHHHTWRIFPAPAGLRGGLGLSAFSSGFSGAASRAGAGVGSGWGTGGSWHWGSQTVDSVRKCRATRPPLLSQTQEFRLPAPPLSDWSSDPQALFPQTPGSLAPPHLDPLWEQESVCSFGSFEGRY